MKAHKWKVILEDYWVSHVYSVTLKDCTIAVLNMYCKDDVICTVMYRNDGFSKIMGSVQSVHITHIENILDRIAAFVCRTYDYVARLPLVRNYSDKSESSICCAFVQLLLEFQYLYDLYGMSGNAQADGLLFNWANSSLLSNGSHKNSAGWLFVPRNSDIHTMQSDMFAVYALPVKAKKYTVRLQLLDIQRGVVQALYLNTVQKCV